MTEELDPTRFGRVIPLLFYPVFYFIRMGITVTIVFFYNYPLA